MTTELRVYTVRDGAMGEFADLFMRRVVPLRRRLGFRVEGVWMAEATNTFAWVVSHDGPGSWDEAVAAYQRARDAEIDPSPSSFLTSVSATVVEPVAVPPA